MPLTGSRGYWQRLRRGPWPEAVIERLEDALAFIAGRLRRLDGVVALALFGSYARGEHGRRSDVDLLFVVRGEGPLEQREAGRLALQLAGEAEARFRLPMHLAPMLAAAEQPEKLGEDLVGSLWRDAVILYGEASWLASIQPEGLAPWTLVRFSVAQAEARERVKLSRRLHGYGSRPGLIRPPALVVGRGAVLVPAELRQQVVEALDEAGALYDLIEVWRAA
jgi:predicted nucleotidyltransferase